MTRIKSVKSAKSGRSKKSHKGHVKTNQQKAEELDQQLDEVTKEIEDNPAYNVLVEERIRKEMGEEYITEGVLPDNLQVDTVFEELRMAHTREITMNEDRKKQLERRKVLLDHRDTLTAQRVELECMMSEQKLMDRRAVLRTNQAMLQLKIQENKQDEEERAFQQKYDSVIKEVCPNHGNLEEEERAIRTRTEQWVRQLQTCRVSVAERKVDAPHSMSGSEIRIAQLEDQLKRTQQQLKAATQIKSSANPASGVEHLWRIGLVPQQFSDRGMQAG